MLSLEAQSPLVSQRKDIECVTNSVSALITNKSLEKKKRKVERQVELIFMPRNPR